MYRRSVLWSLIFVLLVSSCVSAQTLKTLYSFPGPANGLQPFSGLVAAGDGNYYGTTDLGGAYNRGTVFRVTPAGALTTIHAFSGADGSEPRAGVILGSDGALYGTTVSSNDPRRGVIYRITTSGEFSVLSRFQAEAVESFCIAPLCEASDGNLYGTTFSGGENNAGSIFRITKAGIYTRLYSNPAGAEGFASPVAQGPDGALYGTNRTGGAKKQGSIFRITTAGDFSVIYSFDDSVPNGSKPVGGLTLAVDGNLYGVTGFGGVSDAPTIFRVTTAGKLTKVHDFEKSFVNGVTPLTQHPDGSLYGATDFGGALSAGYVFKFETGGAFTYVADLGDGNGGLDLRGPFATSSDGSIFTSAYSGGLFNQGAVVRVGPQGIATNLFSFGPPPNDAPSPYTRLVQASDGNFYGTTVKGGTANVGSVYRITPSGEATTVHSFTGPDGKYPSGLTLASDGNFYCTTISNGTPGGHIIRIATNGAFAGIFTYASSSWAYGDIGGSLLAANGMLYGTTTNGGTNQGGTVFKMPLTGTGITVVHALNGAIEGAGPAALSIGRDGGLFGVCYDGGASGGGTIFQVGKDDAFRVVHTFAGSEGAGPNAPLVLARDGNYYGVATSGGTLGHGTVYRLGSDNSIVSIHDFTEAEGHGLRSSLVLGEDGALYGTFLPFEVDANGSIFKITTGGSLTTAYSFSPSPNGANADGAGPLSGLILARDGNLYGVCPRGGQYGFGTVFRLVIPHHRLIVQNKTDRRIAMMTLNGTTVTTSRSITPTVPDGWRVAAYADFDGDDQSDIIIQNATTGAITVLFLNGDTIRESRAVNIVPPKGWEVVASGDFNNDGRPDLVVQNVNTQQISVLLMNGPKITGSLAMDKSLLPGWRVVGVGDFDGDGFLDFVAQETATRRISIVTEQGMKVKGSVPLYPTLSEGWSVGAVGDYNGDGKPDLVVQNSSTGQVSILTIADFKIKASLPVKPVPLPVWKLVGPR